MAYRPPVPSRADVQLDRHRSRTFDLVDPVGCRLFQVLPGELVHTPTDRQPERGQVAGDLELMVVHMFALRVLARDENGHPPGLQRGECRADAGMGDHEIGLAHCRLKLECRNLSVCGQAQAIDVGAAGLPEDIRVHGEEGDE